MHRRHGDNSGKQTERSGGEKGEESPGNHDTQAHSRACGCCGLVSLTSHLLSSFRDQVRVGNSEGRVLGAEPSAVTVPAAEGNGSLGRRAGQGAPGTTSQEETLPWPLLQPALLSMTKGTTSRDTRETSALPPGNTGSKWSKRETSKDLRPEGHKQELGPGLSGSWKWKRLQANFCPGYLQGGSLPTLKSSYLQSISRLLTPRPLTCSSGPNPHTVPSYLHVSLSSFFFFHFYHHPLPFSVTR